MQGTAGLRSTSDPANPTEQTMPPRIDKLLKTRSGPGQRRGSKGIHETLAGWWPFHVSSECGPGDANGHTIRTFEPVTGGPNLRRRKCGRCARGVECEFVCATVLGCRKTKVVNGFDLTGRRATGLFLARRLKPAGFGVPHPAAWNCVLTKRRAKGVHRGFVCTSPLARLKTNGRQACYGR